MFTLFDFIEKRKRKLSLGFLFLIVILVWAGVFQAPEDQLHIWVFDVGQGDSILIRTPGNHKILIDGGPDDRVLSRLGEHLPFWEKTIDLVVISHPDADHITGLTGVLKNYRVRKILASECSCGSRICGELEDLILEKNISRWAARSGGKVSFGNSTMAIFWPPENCHLGTNDCSAILLFDFTDFEALFPGDVEESGQRGVISQSVVPSAEVLKVPHHGADSLWEPFLKSVGPKLSVISVGKNNSYGHPAEATLEKLKNIGSEILRTDRDGTVEIISDGENWWGR